MDPLEMEGPPLDAGEGDVSGVANAHEAAIKVAGTDEAARKILRALKTSTLDWAEDGACTLTIVGTDGVTDTVHIPAADLAAASDEAEDAESERPSAPPPPPAA